MRISTKNSSKKSIMSSHHFNIKNNLTMESIEFSKRRKFWIMESNMKVSGMNLGKGMVVECKSGLMVQFMKVIGKKIKLMARVESFMRMDIFMKAIGKQEKLMASQTIHMQTVHVMKENGLMINNMEKEKKYGQMAQHLKEIIRMGLKMVSENSIGQTGQHTKVLSRIIAWMDMDFTNGMMADSIMVVGRKIR